MYVRMYACPPRIHPMACVNAAAPNGSPKWFRDLQERCGALRCSTTLLQWSLDTLKGSSSSRDLSALASALAPPCSARTLARRFLRISDATALHWLLESYRDSAGQLVANDDASQPLFFVDTQGNRGDTETVGADAAGEADVKERAWHERTANVISALTGGDDGADDSD